MKKNLSLLVACIGCWYVYTLAANNPPSTQPLTKQVEVASFHSITATNSVDVLYTQSSGKQEIEIYTTPRLMELVEVVVENGVLQIGLKRNTKSSFIQKEPLEVRVTAPAVETLKATSSGDIKLTNGLTTSGKLLLSASSSGDIKGGNVACGELVVKTSSSGDIKLEDINTQAVIADASSSGDIELKKLTAIKITAKSSSSSEIELTGRCEQAIFTASSSGDIDAKNLKATEVEASANSSGEISCYATRKLSAQTSSSGEVKYRGTPQQVVCDKKAKVRKI